jgi:hypothetical protein
MDNAFDSWPGPKFTFHPGPSGCLHAVGVISSCYNSFDRILFDIYLHYLERKKLPRKLCELYYLSLPEEQRLDAIKYIFDALEKNRKVRKAIENLVQYFRWCWLVRNSILHGEPYPTILVDPNDLNLVKRKKKRSSELEYHSFTLGQLRDYAEKIETGRMQAAKINLHLRYRAMPPKRRSVALQVHAYEPLPRILHIPNPLEGSEHPLIGQARPTRPRLPAGKD